MSNRVNVNITARDLTRPELARMRNNFRNLGQDMDRMVSDRSRANFDRLSQSIRNSRRDLDRLRGSIPDHEFFRLDEAMRRAQRTMSRGLGRMTSTQLARIRQDLDTVRNGFRGLDDNAQIRVRTDLSALRRADVRLDAWRRQQRLRPATVRVRVDTDGNRVQRSLMRTLTAPLRAIGGLIGGTLSDGVGQGIADGMKAAGPLVGAVLVTAILAALSVVGAALSGILVTALGLAFVGIGGVSAAMSKQVKDQWSKTLVSLKKDFKEVGEPMIPVLDRAIQRMEKMANEAAPKLKASIEAAAPETETFINRIMDGFKSFGKAAFDPIMEAWKVFSPVFGSEWNEFMDELGNSFGRMADLVRQHPTEIAAALDVVFEAIDLLVDTVTFFGKVWVFTMQNAGDAVGFFLQALGVLAHVAFDSLGLILDAAVKAFGWVPGLGGKLKDAQSAFGEFRDGVMVKLNDMAQSAFGWDDALNKANRKRQLDADIATWQHKLQLARADLKKTTSQKAKAKVEANIADLTAKLANARAQLNSLNGKTATTYVVTSYQQIRNKGYAGNSATGGRAHGGVIGTAATGGVRSNMTLVGEQGPELVDLAPGSHVRSNADTRRFLGVSGGGGGQMMQVNVVVDGKVLARALFDPMRGEIRDRGGNVQSALGQRGA
jgi:hypothetical protein